MDCTILKAFPFSRDGITVEHALPNSVCDIPDILVNGLKDAGYLSTDGTAPIIPATALAPQGDPAAAAPAATPPAAPAGSEGGDLSDEAKKAAALAAIEIPADFETLHHMQQFNLAKRISGEQPTNRAAAIDVIKAELARRAAVAG